MSKYKTILFATFGAVVFLVLMYLAVFGRALGQRENHVAIAIALPKVFLTSKPVRIDEQTYLAKDIFSFTKAMESQGFIHIEQLGSGHIFEKDGKRYISVSRMYSSRFMIFTYPKEN